MAKFHGGLHFTFDVGDAPDSFAYVKEAMDRHRAGLTMREINPLPKREEDPSERVRLWTIADGPRHYITMPRRGRLGPLELMDGEGNVLFISSITEKGLSPQQTLEKYKRVDEIFRSF